jgi:hypothetical protein
VIILSGTRSSAYREGSLPPGAVIDARSALFLASPSNLYPINLDGGAGVCVAGGTVQGEYDRNLSWAAMHSMNNAGIRIGNADSTIDGIRIDNVEDGIRPIAGFFTIRNARLSYIRDDCVENDHVQPGTIEDSLFDGCYAAISERPSPSIAASGYDGRNDLLTIRGTLIRLEAMPGPRGGTTSELGHAQFFKWDALSTKLALYDNIFMAETVATSGASTMDMPDTLTDCSNNVMVWLGPGNYPAPLPSCFTVTTDRGLWDAAVADWEARHLEIDH